MEAALQERALTVLTRNKRYPNRKTDRNYLLSGLVPYTSFGTKDLAKDPGPGKQLADVEIETQFNWFDFVVSIVPGLYYGYYVWAPRHVGYKAVVVESHSQAVAATR